MGSLTPICGGLGSRGNAEHRKSGEDRLPGTTDADFDELWAEVAHLIAIAEQD